MKRFCMALLAGIAVLALHAGLADAASRYISSTGTSSGSGICSITIESFGPPEEPGFHPMVVVAVPIPNSSSASNSASLIRAQLDSDLPPDFEAILPAGMPGVVKLNYKPGTFSMGISENVPGQTIVETSPNLPVTGPIALSALGLALAAGGLFVLQRRRRAAATLA
jgi:LPXTG-motif cell wall-anchored protein